VGVVSARCYTETIHLKINGQNHSFVEFVCPATDTNPLISWGDGTYSAATFTREACSAITDVCAFSVTGSHTYRLTQDEWTVMFANPYAVVEEYASFSGCWGTTTHTLGYDGIAIVPISYCFE